MKKYSAPRTTEKMKILGAVLELKDKKHYRISPFTSKLGHIGPYRQSCLAGSSKTAHRILIFSIAMGADYLFYVKTIVTHARAFFKVIIFLQVVCLKYP